mmetsp:Transcript_72201/g.202642  ORF Transcript_72201/g.202642 Transcript_72201/m.202642 type:complete len:108 (-) Transcript_72201:3-326(-)
MPTVSMTDDLSMGVLLFLWAISCAPILVVYTWASSGARGKTTARPDGEDARLSPLRAERPVVSIEEPLCVQLIPLHPETIEKIRYLVAINESRRERQGDEDFEYRAS